MRELSGVLIKDSLRYRRAWGHQPSVNGDPPWVRLHNRIEQLEVNPQGPGVHCLWKYSSRLHACDVIPGWGRTLLNRVLEDWEFQFADSAQPAAKSPQVSFLFAHAGRSRLPQLQHVIRSVYAQRDVSVECIVVDLTEDSILGSLPSGTIGKHVDTRHLAPGWYKAWAFNIAAKLARGEILVFQDGDICIPTRYAAELVKRFERGGCGAASLQRFLFYLTAAESSRLIRGAQFPQGCPEAISQNWKGGTIAVHRDAFFSLGGFDEGFVNWGGEDDEFYDRCSHVQHCRYGYIPFIHLWHAPQSLRHAVGNPNIDIAMPARMSIPVADRVQELIKRGCGDLKQPHPLVAYKDSMQVIPPGKVTCSEQCAASSDL